MSEHTLFISLSEVDYSGLKTILEACVPFQYSLKTKQYLSL